MRLDTQCMFSDAQSLSGTSANSTNTLDLQGAGIAENEAFVVVRFAGSHGCTAVDLQGSEDNSEFASVVKTAVSDTTEGAGVSIRLPQGCPRYLKLVYTGTTLGGTVTAGVTLQTPSPRGKRLGDYAANKG